MESLLREGREGQRYSGFVTCEHRIEHTANLKDERKVLGQKISTVIPLVT